MKSIKILVALSLVNLVIVIIAAKFMKPTRIAPTTNTTSSMLNTEVIKESGVTPSLNPSVVPVQVSPQKATNPPTQVPVASVVPITTTPTPTPTSISTPTPTPPPAPSGCLVQIDGVTYDVTRLRQTHSGGDIFSCGTDMSQIFWSQHNQNILNKMQQYRI